MVRQKSPKHPSYHFEEENPVIAGWCKLEIPINYKLQMMLQVSSNKIPLPTICHGLSFLFLMTEHQNCSQLQVFLASNYYAP